MKQYIIKAEHIDDFGATMDERLIDEQTVEMCARGWEKSIEEVLDMVEEVEPGMKEIFMLAIRTTSHGSDRTRWFWSREEAATAYESYVDSLEGLALKNWILDGEAWIETRLTTSDRSMDAEDAAYADTAVLTGVRTRILSREELA